MNRRFHLFVYLLLFATAATEATADVYVANPGEQITTPPSILVFAPSVIGNAAPVRTIKGAATQLNYPQTVTLDEENGELYVADFFGQAIRVYDLAANGNAAPLRTLVNGPNSGISQVRAVAVDQIHNEIVILSINNSIRTFTRTASGDAVPLRVIAGSSTRLNNPIALVLDLVHDEILVDSYAAAPTSAGIVVFPRAGFGNIAPLRVIGGNRTGFHNFVNAMALDLDHDEIFAQGGFGDSIMVFPRTATGNVFPLRRLGGPSTGLVTAGAIAIDAVNEQRATIM